MELNFPKIVRPIDLGDYADEMKGQILQVWVNPATKFLNELNDQYKAHLDKDDPQYLQSMSELLSQGEDKIPVEDLEKMIAASLETDPAFWAWLQDKIVRMITDHRLGLKKVSAQPPPP